MATPELTIYVKPTCSTCRNLAKLLRENSIDFDRVDYIMAPLTADELRALLKKLGIPARDLLRTKDPQFAGSQLGPESGEDEIIAAIADQPELMQRPIVVRGNRAVIARPPERALELF
jgi:arsenate reductase